MPKTLQAIMEEQKKVNGQADLEKIKKKRETETEMENLELSELEYKEFLEKRDLYIPTLHDVNAILDDLVVAEFTSRMSIFSALILGFQNVYVSGLSGSGKTQLLDACSSLAMPSDICLIEGGSEKNLLDRQRDIEKCKWLIISEINKVDSVLTIEYLKTAAEGKYYHYDRGGAKPIRIELPPKPWAVSRADESATSNPIGIEMMSRLVEIVTDSSEEQTSNILDRKAEKYQFPFRVNKINIIDKSCLRWHISQLPEIDIYVNPAAKLLTNIIPTIFVSARRRYDNYVLNCNGITKFHWKERIIGEIEGKSVIFVSPIDIWENHLIFGQHLVDAALQVSDIQKLMMKIIIDTGGLLTKAEIQQELRHYSLNLPIKTIETHVTHLSDLGYLNIDKASRENAYTATDFFTKFELKPDMQKIVECAKHTMLSEPLYKPYADEYIERFCDLDNMEVLNPFTGIMDNMLTYNFGNVFGVEEGSTRMKSVNAEEKNKTKSSDMSLNKWF